LSEIQECRAAPMQIDLRTPQKMFRRQFRLSEDDKQEVAKQITEMEKFGIIEETKHHGIIVAFLWLERRTV